MIVKFDSAGIRNSKFYEHLIRFVLGGLISVIVGFIGEKWGPVVAGLFMAFPAIFPAAATMIQTRQEEKKRKAGYDGRQRGISAAGADAVGAGLGSAGLAVFAWICWRLLGEHSAGMVLAVAVVAWMGCAVSIWFLWKRVL